MSLGEPWRIGEKLDHLTKHFPSCTLKIGISQNVKVVAYLIRKRNSAHPVPDLFSINFTWDIPGEILEQISQFKKAIDFGETFFSLGNFATEKTG